MLATLQRKEAQEKVLTEKWTEKWRETQQILQEQKALGLRKSGLGVVLDSDMPHLVGIDDNLLSTGVTLYHLKVSGTGGCIFSTLALKTISAYIAPTVGYRPHSL